MKLNMKFSDEQVISAGKTRKTKMRLSEHAQQVVFAMFTKNVYSNPIGSIVREVTSNCYDAIKEAGVDTPVVVELKKDMSDSKYISFIDKGIGMSPERVEKIYGVYFESSKRDTNDQIGGFGIGGKTPMAYTNSFFVITTSEKEKEWEYNNRLSNELYEKIDMLSKSDNEEEIAAIEAMFGTLAEMEQEIDRLEKRNTEILDSDLPKIEYVYSIYKGENSPEIELLQSRFVDQSNGTEVKVPIKKDDVYTFEREVLRQLYYFENIVLKGFSDNYVTNDYQIYKGKSFLYRANDMNPQYNSVHVCLGQVAYPIDFSALDISSYEYNIPVAIKLNIGDINVTASRESLDYNDNTKKLLKEKLVLIKEELTNMLIKQYDNVQTLQEYYEVTENYGSLTIMDKKISVGNLVSRNKINYNNFKYNSIIDYLPKSHNILNLMFDVRRYGKKKKKARGNYDVWSGGLDTINDHDNIYYSTWDFKRVMLKQSYLADKHNEIFFIVLPKNFNYAGNYDAVVNKLESISKKYEFDKIIDGRKLLLDLQKDVWNMIKNGSESYNDLVVPQEFIEYKKNNKKNISKDILKKDIPVKSPDTYGNGARIKIKTIYDFKGRVFYGNSDDEPVINYASKLYDTLFDEKHNKSRFSTYNENNPDKGIMFIQISKQNSKLIEKFNNVHHVNEFLVRMVTRKINKIVEAHNMYKIKLVFSNDIDNIFGKDIFKYVNNDLYESYQVLHSKIYGSNIKIVNDSQICWIKSKLNIDLDSYEFEYQDLLDKLVDVSNKSKKYLQYIDIPWYCNDGEKYSDLIDLVKMVLKDII